MYGIVEHCANTLYGMHNFGLVHISDPLDGKQYQAPNLFGIT